MTRSSPKSESFHAAGYLVGLGFLLLAGALFTLSPMIQIPLEPPVQVSLDDLKLGAFRDHLTDPPMVEIDGVVQRCSECHSTFTGVRQTDRPLTQHTDIVINHGINDGCLNCHDTADREKLAIRGGPGVGYDKVELLCAQCHGPIYHDWKNGAHGKTIGFWDGSSGKPIKLTCTQCHDPHSPAFEPMAPLPGPRTLRMGDPGAYHEEVIDERNPLQMWHLDGPSGASHKGAEHEDHSSEEGAHE